MTAFLTTPPIVTHPESILGNLATPPTFRLPAGPTNSRGRQNEYGPEGQRGYESTRRLDQRDTEAWLPDTCRPPRMGVICVS